VWGASEGMLLLLLLLLLSALRVKDHLDFYSFDWMQTKSLKERDDGDGGGGCH
jgi:hypothetical protein